MSSILIVDDQTEVLESIELALQSAGYQVVCAVDGLQALNALRIQKIDLLISDIAMPDLNGYQLYEEVRSNPEWSTLPFLFLTARALDSDIRYGKALGVDDYLVKPIHRGDLLAAVKGKLRRAHQLQTQGLLSNHRGHSDEEIICVGSLAIDVLRHQVWLSSQQIYLAAREFALLVYLARHVERVVPHRELIQVTHEFETDDSEASELLRPLVRSLRRKLGFPVNDMGCIETIRGVGYRLTPPM